MTEKRTKHDIEKIFNQLEKQIILKLKNNKLSIEKSDDGSQIKKKLKKYQSNLKEIIQNFREYERLSDDLLEIEQEKIDAKFKKFNSLPKIKTDKDEEIALENGKVKIIKKKRNIDLER